MGVIICSDGGEYILGLECEFKVFDEINKCNIKPYTKTGDMFLVVGKGILMVDIKLI